MYRSNDFKLYKENIDFNNISIPCDNSLNMFFKIGYMLEYKVQVSFQTIHETSKAAN